MSSVQFRASHYRSDPERITSKPRATSFFATPNLKLFSQIELDCGRTILSLMVTIESQS
jgi:hypothetical protein